MIHFKYFPQVEYSNELTTNLLARGKVREMIKNESALYYSYTVRDEDRADIISTKYYGSSDYTWLIYYANDIHDPQYDWPLTSKQFDNFIVSKYGSGEAAQQKLHHYEVDGTEVYIAIDNPGAIIEDLQLSAEQPNANFLASKLPKIPEAISAYAYEEALNLAKRNILIIDKAFLQGVVYELQHLFK